MSTALLVDGHSLLFRAHFAFMRNPLSSSTGVPTSALHGFLAMVKPLLAREHPDYVAVAFDVSRKTFRSTLYPEYKAHRDETPQEIRAQTPLAKDLLCAMGLRCVELADYEGDDVLGTLSRRFAEAGTDVTIVTGDRDALQLVSERVRVLLTKKGISETALYGPDAIRAEFHLDPRQLIDVKALQGDTSDNIPGVPGVGEKTALKLIVEHGSLEGLYDHLDAVGGPKVRESLAANREVAFLSRKLATIECAAPLGVELEECRPQEPDRARLLAMLTDLQLTVHAQDVQAPPDDRPAPTEAVVGAAAFAALLDRLRSARRLALDTETTSEDATRARLVGLSFCFEEGRAYYLPLDHDDPASRSADLPAEAILGLLKPLLERPELEVVGHNLKYDYKVLKRHGVDVRGLWCDTLLAAYLVDPTRKKFGLDVVSLEYLRHAMQDFKQVLGDREHFGQVPLEAAARYSGDDAEVAFRLAATLAPAMERDGCAGLFRSLEMPLVRVLADMELDGIWLDQPYLQELGAAFQTEIESVEKEIFAVAGEPFNLASPKQLGRILFEKLQLPVITRTKTGPSTDADVLEQLEIEHGADVARRINRHRHLTKLKGTYVDPLPGMTGEDGRLHTTFNQFFTATGRLSSSDPNLQNIPVRTEDGLRIRRAFRAHPEGTVFVSADYSQVELRLLAHLCKAPLLVEAFRGGRDIHRETAARLFGLDPAAVTDEQRGRAKAINFGIIYGQGAFGLSQQLRIPKKEAGAFIEEYFARMPEVRTWKDSVIEQARADGYATTMLGRRRPVPELAGGKGRDKGFGERIAVNTTIQGSAADLIKKAMVVLPERLRAAGLRARLLLQIHDELVLEAPAAEVEALAQVLRETMEGAMELDVPLTVTCGRGPTWADLK